jgi:lambda repressor-like predicted transcriptional regulator
MLRKKTSKVHGYNYGTVRRTLRRKTRKVHRIMAQIEEW